MAAALLCRALHIHRVLVCPTPHLPVAPTHHLLSSTPATTTASRQNAATPIDLSSDESRRHLVNRLVYRSKQRGFLELDLVLGSWVEQHVRAMDERGWFEPKTSGHKWRHTTTAPGKPRFVEMAFWSGATTRGSEF